MQGLPDAPHVKADVDLQKIPRGVRPIFPVQRSVTFANSFSGETPTPIFSKFHILMGQEIFRDSKLKPSKHECLSWAAGQKNHEHGSPPHQRLLLQEMWQVPRLEIRIFSTNPNPDRSKRSRKQKNTRKESLSRKKHILGKRTGRILRGTP